jgi:hypothetical protein
MEVIIMYDDIVNELVRFNPYHHVNEPYDMLLFDILQALKHDEDLANRLNTLILNKEWQEED